MAPAGQKSKELLVNESILNDGGMYDTYKSGNMELSTTRDKGLKGKGCRTVQVSDR